MVTISSSGSSECHWFDYVAAAAHGGNSLREKSGMSRTLNMVLLRLRLWLLLLFLFFFFVFVVEIVAAVAVVLLLCCCSQHYQSTSSSSFDTVLLIFNSPRGLTFTWWGCCGLCFWHKPTELAHSFLFCSCAYFCLSFNCISFHKFSRQLPAFSLCSSGLISALLVL